MNDVTSEHDSLERSAAKTRLKVRRDFMLHLGAWLIVNAMLLAIWWLTGPAGIWPIWLMLFWGVALAFHGWWAFFGQTASEAAIRREMDR